MANSRIGRELLIGRVQQVLNLPTKKEAEELVSKVITCIEDTLIENLDKDKFSMKLNSFGKFSIHHKPGIKRLIPFTHEVKMTDAKRKVKFVALGRLRQLERVTKDEVVETDVVENNSIQVAQ
jgi:nucleoid DNA-binding protein